MQVNGEAILDSWQREGIFLAGVDLAKRQVTLR
jgi:hypothetical protein